MKDNIQESWIEKPLEKLKSREGIFILQIDANLKKELQDKHINNKSKLNL